MVACNPGNPQEFDNSNVNKPDPANADPTLASFYEAKNPLSASDFEQTKIEDIQKDGNSAWVELYDSDQGDG